MRTETIYHILHFVSRSYRFYTDETNIIYYLNFTPVHERSCISHYHVVGVHKRFCPCAAYWVLDKIVLNICPSGIPNVRQTLFWRIHKTHIGSFPAAELIKNKNKINIQCCMTHNAPRIIDLVSVFVNTLELKYPKDYFTWYSFFTNFVQRCFQRCSYQRMVVHSKFPSLYYLE